MFIYLLKLDTHSAVVIDMLQSASLFVSLEIVMSDANKKKVDLNQFIHLVLTECNRISKFIIAEICRVVQKPNH